MSSKILKPNVRLIKCLPMNVFADRGSTITEWIGHLIGLEEGALTVYRQLGN